MSKTVIISVPHNIKKVLLHSCCAPCSGEIMATLSTMNIDYTIFFYNPNIHPRKEYEIRKDENKRFAEKHQIPFIDADYDVDEWYERTKGLEFTPERGARCTICFDMRFERAALYAHENDFQVFTSSMGISRWKDMQQVNTAGKRAAEKYPNVTYWDYNWRKQGGSQRMLTIAKQEKFYKQEYCGCAHSLREANQRRKEQNRDKIVIGINHYTE